MGCAHAAPARHSERVVRTARKLHPPLAAKLRNPTATCVTPHHVCIASPTSPHAPSRSNAPAGRPYSRSKVTYMCGQDRRLVLGGMYVFSGASCV